MNYLVIYDNTGKIYAMTSGNYELPVGIQYLEVEVPEGKYLKEIDMTGDSPEPVLVSYETGDINELRNMLLQQIEVSEEQSAALMELGEIIASLLQGGN